MANESLAVGHRILGRYEVIGVLGQGGMGVVYRCLDLVSDMLVAVKGLSPKLSGDAAWMADVKRNYQVVAELRHSCIAGLRNLEQDETGAYYLVMDYVRGHDLPDYIAEHKLTLENTFILLTDVADALDYAHGEGEHTVTWTYIKDDVEAQGEDCVWVADYAWASDYTTTQTTDVPVPYAWLTEKSRDIVDEYDIYEKVAKQTAYNPRFTVEQCYVAGLDPESTTNEFTTSIEMVDGVPNISWKPDLKAERTYKIWGSTNLVNGGEWEWPTNALHRFFKVTVEMK